MKARIVILATMLLVLAAVLAPLAEAGSRRP
jgi:hypothetical protein